MNGLQNLLPRTSCGALLAAALMLLAVVPAAPAGAQVGADPIFSGFEPVGTYALSASGKPVPGAEIYQSERARAFLVLSSDLESPLLLNMRSRRVETVGFMSLARRGDGTIDVLADAEIRPVSSFDVSEDGVTFAVGGRQLALTSRESLTGRRDAEALTEYDPSYARGAATYEPNASLVSQLEKQEKPVRVQVFFNSKCSVCKQMVPKIIALERALQGSKVEFDYYGAPDDYEDPELEKRDVHGVPTGIVYVNGKEVGRIVGGEWRMPELAIKNVLLQGS
jgi:thiol-disulfide isomerase/thioredoxin